MPEQESSTPVGTEAGTPRSILELMSVPQFDTAMETIRLGENATLVIPFTTAVATVSSHYANYGEMRGYYRCNVGDGSTCDLCRIGNAKKDRHLLPVYDPVDRRVAVLMSGSRNPEALLPQMVDLIKRHDVEQEAMLVTIVKPTKMTYRVEARPLPEKADRGI